MIVSVEETVSKQAALSRFYIKKLRSRLGEAEGGGMEWEKRRWVKLSRGMSSK